MSNAMIHTMNNGDMQPSLRTEQRETKTGKS